MSAVGSLKEEHRPLDFVIPDQFFDRTRGRVSTFFGEGLVAHISFADPDLPAAGRSGRERLLRRPASMPKRGGTYLCMEGPAFSTKAESNVYRSWGMDVIGMTNLQEAKLAREAEICYVTVAMVTDYDCWHPEHDAVTVTDIIANLTKNAENACESGERGGRRDARIANLQMRIGAGARADHEPRRCSCGTRVRSWSCWLASTSAAELLQRCLDGEPWTDDLLCAALAEEDGRAFFRIVVERLGDLFEPRLCDDICPAVRASASR